MFTNSINNSNKVYAVGTGVLEVAVAYKLLESVFWTVGSYYLIDSACRHLTDDIPIPDTKEDFVLSGGALNVINVTRERFLQGPSGGGEPEPEPEDKIRFGVPLSREQIRKAYNLNNDDEVVQVATELHNGMTEDERVKWENDLAFKIQLGRKTRKQLEKTIVPMIDTLINPVQLVDYTTLPIFSDGSSSISLGSVDFFRHKNRIDTTNKFVNLCINNGVKNIVMFTLNDFNSKTSIFPDVSRELYPYPSVFSYNLDSSILVGFFDGSYSFENVVYIGSRKPSLPAWNVFVKRVSLDSEALIVGDIIGKGFDVISDDKMYLRLSTFENGDERGKPNLDCITVTNFEIPPDLDLGAPEKLPVSLPNLDDLPIVVPPINSALNYDNLLDTIFNDDNMFDLLMNQSHDPDLDPDLDPDKDFNIPFLGDIYQVLLNILNFLRNMINKFVVAFTEMLKSLFIPSSDFISDFIAELDSVLKNKLGTNIYMPFINNLKELKGIPFPDLYIYGSKVVDASFLNSMADTSKLWQRWFYYFLIIFYNLNNVYKLVRNNDIIGRTATGDFKS